MTTRLDRLLLLLDTGSTPSIRLTAARQLGQIAAQTVQHSSVSHVPCSSSAPTIGSSANQCYWRGVDGEWNEIVNLLGRILPYLRSKNWETRQAASEAVDAICKAIGIWDPSPTEVIDDSPLDFEDKKPSLSFLECEESHQNTQRASFLTFESFRLDAVLSEGTILLASAGKEFDYQSTHPRSGESLLAAKRDVAHKLGLGLASFSGLDLESFDVTPQEPEGPLKDSFQYPTPHSRQPPCIDPIAIDPRPLAIPPKDCHTCVTPVSEVVGLSAPGLSELPQVATLSQPNWSSYPSAEDQGTSSVKSTPTLKSQSLPPTGPTSEVEMPADSLEGLSARERNALKRKRKAFSKGSSGPSSSVPSSSNIGISSTSNASESLPISKFRIIEQPSVPSDDPHSRLAVSTASSAHHPTSQVTPYFASEIETPTAPPTSASNVVIVDPGAKAKTRRSTVDHTSSTGGGEVNATAGPHHLNNQLHYVDGQWPFTSFVEVLMIDLFSSQWEYRHGAALGLIPLLKIQGSGAAKSVTKSSLQSERRVLRPSASSGAGLIQTAYSGCSSYSIKWSSRRMFGLIPQEDMLGKCVMQD